MTTDEKFDLILSRLNEMQSDILSIKSDISTMQDDITIIKSDVKKLKNIVVFNRKPEMNIIDYIENRLNEKLDSKINQLKAELNKTA